MAICKSSTMNSEPKNGIIYCRVSSLEQVEGTSLESQERVCKEYAQRENINVLKVFIEKGESAKTADRTEFIKAISFCSEKKNKVDYFVVYKLDRFARNQEDHISIRATLKKYKTELRSVTEPINESATGKLMEGILSSFAEFDNSIRTERSVNGMKERIKQGIWVWQAPIGYCRLEKGANISPDSKLAPYVKMAFEEYAKGIYTYEALAQFLNERGFTTKQGNNAIPQLVEKIIKNPLYCGIIRVWDMEYRGKFEPLISEQLFYQCQDGGHKTRTVSHQKQNPHFPLRRFIHCHCCGKPLTGSTSRGRHGGRYAYYHHQRQDCASASFIPKETFEQMFVEHLIKINPSIEYENAFKAIVLDIWKNNFKRIDLENERIRKEIKVLEQQRQRIFDLHQTGVYTDQEFLLQKDIVSKKLAQKMALIHEKKSEELNMDEALEYCFNFVRNTAQTWLNLAKKPDKRIRFQKMIFEDNLIFDGEKFGTAKLTPIYSLYQQYLVDPSTLVTLPGVEPGFSP